jgi:Protein of unknown function (DUF3828)
MKRVSLLVVFALFAALAPAGAGELDEQVRRLYRTYETDAPGPSALQLVRPHASKRLAALIAREERCTNRHRGEPCNLDFDVIINGQDWTLKNLAVEPATLDGDRASVVARFTNIDTPQEIVYRYTRESGRWRIDDIEATAPADHRWALSRILAGPIR